MNRFLAKIITELVFFVLSWLVQHKIIFRRKEVIPRGYTVVAQSEEEENDSEEAEGVVMEDTYKDDNIVSRLQNTGSMTQVFTLQMSYCPRQSTCRQRLQMILTDEILQKKHPRSHKIKMPS